MTKYTLDRFEGEMAVLLLKGDETAEKLLNREQLPPGIKEGDILELFFKENGELQEARILKDETTKARNEAQSLLEKLKNKNK